MPSRSSVSLKKKLKVPPHSCTVVDIDINTTEEIKVEVMPDQLWLSANPNICTYPMIADLKDREPNTVTPFIIVNFSHHEHLHLPKYHVYHVSASRGVSAPSGGVCSRGGLLQGGSTPGGSAPRGWGCLLLGCVCSGGCLLFGGVCSKGGICSQGWVVSQHALRQTPPVNRITDMSKNITLATTSWRPVKNYQNFRTVYYTVPLCLTVVDVRGCEGRNCGGSNSFNLMHFL